MIIQDRKLKLMKKRKKTFLFSKFKEHMKIQPLSSRKKERKLLTFLKFLELKFKRKKSNHQRNKSNM